MADEPTYGQADDSDWRPFKLTLSDDPFDDWALGDGKPFIAGAEDQGREWYAALLRVEGDALGTANVDSGRTGDRIAAALASADPADALRSVDGIVAPTPFDDATPRARRSGGTRSRTVSVVIRIDNDPDTPPPDGIITQLTSTRLRARAAAAESGALDSAVPGGRLGMALRSDSINANPEAIDGEEFLTDFDKDGLVVVGVIDDGIAFANDRFRLPGGGSRVVRAWLQDAPETPGSPVFYGRDVTRQQIDLLIGQHTHAGLLDEDAFYRDIGLNAFAARDENGVQQPSHKTVARRQSHGTHVLDTVTGYGRDEPEARKRPIVSVQLPPGVTWDTSGVGLDPHVHAGINYIFERAKEIGTACGIPKVPVVINFSYGIAGGPHDGLHPLERAIDELIADRVAPEGVPENGQPTAIVIPAGNGHLARRHARMRFAGENEIELPWRVLPDDRTPSYLEIWMPPRDLIDTASRMTVEVVPPGRAVTGFRLGEEDGSGLFWAPDGDVLARLTYDRRSEDGRGRFLVTLAPTTVLDGARQAAPQGVWRIVLRNGTPGSERQLAPSETVEAWIQRDDTPYGYPTRGRQSFLDDPRYVRFEDPKNRHELSGKVQENDPPDIQLHPWVRREGTINGIATGYRPIVIGGFIRRSLNPAPYSAGGSSTGVDTPDASGPSDDSYVLGGVLGAGTRSGSVAALNGTSVAAPLVAREIARVMGGGTPMNGLTLGAVDPWKTYIQALATAREGIAPQPTRPLPKGMTAASFALRAGKGRIDLAPRIDRVQV